MRINAAGASSRAFSSFLSKRFDAKGSAKALHNAVIAGPKAWQDCLHASEMRGSQQENFACVSGHRQCYRRESFSLQ